MKTVQLTVLGFFALILFSCQKDIKSAAGSENQAQAFFKNGFTQLSNSKPDLTASQNPATASLGSPVTITYNATDPDDGSPVSCGKIMIYLWDGTDWVEVANGAAPSASYQFTPSVSGTCAYKFRAGFAPGGGSGITNCSGSYSGVDHLTEADFCVDIPVNCVQLFTIDSAVTATNLGGGLYQFDITYTLTSPVSVQDVKFQGGATAGGSTGHAIKSLGDFVVVNENNNNTVLKWEGDLDACTPMVLTFSYTRNFSCPASNELVTGSWSASTINGLLGQVMPVEYSCN